MLWVVLALRRWLPGTCERKWGTGSKTWLSLCTYSPGPVVRRRTAKKRDVEEGGFESLVESLALIIDFGGYLWQGA